MKMALTALVLAAAIAAGNWAIVGQEAVVRGCAPCLSWLLGAPFVLAFLMAAAAPRLLVTPEPVAVPSAPPVPPAEPPEHGALRLLATLQEDGRLVDFLLEDIAPYSDEQIGAATRGIHESAAKALRACVQLEPVMPGAEGERVTLAADFDPTAVRLVGNVHGAPPFDGALRHAGWRATAVTLPPRAGQDPQVIAPAEVEVA